MSSNTRNYVVTWHAAYEYVADSEEYLSESTMSSIHEATQETLMEPVSEDIVSIDEDVVQMADVQWCLRSLVETQQTELVSQFRLDVADKHKLIERDYTVDELVTSNITRRTQTRVDQQTHRFRLLNLRFLNMHVLIERTAL